MSQYPRVVLADTEVAWGEPSCTVWVRHGTVADVIPGSALEAAYGPSNLAALSPVSRDEIQDKSALAN